MKKQSIKECALWLDGHDNYLILTHRNPDGDTLGSAAALCSALRRKGKNAAVYPNPGITAKFAPYIDAYLASKEYEADCIIAVDIASGNLLPDGVVGKIDLVIDHHPSNSLKADNSLVYSKRSSCGEIIFDIIKRFNGDIAKEEATALYVAVSTDTGCFQFANVNADTFKTASMLLESGANFFDVNVRFFRKVALSRIKLEGLMYNGLEMFLNNTVAVVTITRDMIDSCGADEDDFSDIAALAGRVEGSKVNVTIREMKDGTSKISVRSIDPISNKICAYFGGGGHAMAAGCTIQADPVRSKIMLLDVIEEVLK